MNVVKLWCICHSQVLDSGVWVASHAVCISWRGLMLPFNSSEFGLLMHEGKIWMIITVENGSYRDIKTRCWTDSHKECCWHMLWYGNAAHFNNIHCSAVESSHIFCFRFCKRHWALFLEPKQFCIIFSKLILLKNIASHDCHENDWIQYNKTTHATMIGAKFNQVPKESKFQH